MRKVVNVLSFLFFDALIEDWNAKPTKDKAGLISGALFFVPSMAFFIWDAKRNFPNGPSNWSFAVIAIAFVCALLLQRHIINKSA